jgi:hypothetical protein
MAGIWKRADEAQVSLQRTGAGDLALDNRLAYLTPLGIQT